MFEDSTKAFLRNALVCLIYDQVNKNAHLIGIFCRFPRSATDSSTGVKISGPFALKVVQRINSSESTHESTKIVGYACSGRLGIRLRRDIASPRQFDLVERRILILLFPERERPERIEPKFTGKSCKLIPFRKQASVRPEIQQRWPVK